MYVSHGDSIKLANVSGTLKFDPVKKMFYFDGGYFNLGLSELEYEKYHGGEGVHGPFNLSQFLMDNYIDKEVNFMIHLEMPDEGPPLREISIEQAMEEIKEKVIPNRQSFDGLIVCDMLNIKLETAHRAINRLEEEGCISARSYEELLKELDDNQEVDCMVCTKYNSPACPHYSKENFIGTDKCSSFSNPNK